MFKILIDNGVTYLFDDIGVEGIVPKCIHGYLINDKNIKEIIESLPISEYYINDTINNEYKIITKEKAFLAYDEIIKANNSISLTYIK